MKYYCPVIQTALIFYKEGGILDRTAIPVFFYKKTLSVDHKAVQQYICLNVLVQAGRTTNVLSLFNEQLNIIVWSEIGKKNNSIFTLLGVSVATCMAILQVGSGLQLRSASTGTKEEDYENDAATIVQKCVSIMSTTLSVYVLMLVWYYIETLFANLYVDTHKCLHRPREFSVY